MMRKKCIQTIFVSCILLAGFQLLVNLSISTAFANEVLLDPLTQPKFINNLPIPARVDATNGGFFEVSITQLQQHLGIIDPLTEAPLMTTVWGYNGTYPGPTFVAQKDTPINVLWKNELVEEGVPLPHLLPVDTTLHWANPAGWPASGVPVVTHLHGGHSESASDGLPEAWFTPGFALTGPDFVKETYTYDNDQGAATLWYHDHALGITRLNVYAGLAGFYLLRDDNEQALIDNNIIPGDPYEIEIAIQDRLFKENGQLFYPAESEGELTENELPEPSVLPEVFGDLILVNGMTWPVLEVEPRKYRFRILNGSDSRFYVLEFRDSMENGISQQFLQIGTEDSLLPLPVLLNQLVIGPGERADLVFDFTDFNGQEIFLRNFGPDEPFKGLNPDGTLNDGEGGVLPPANPATTGQVMKFEVNLAFSDIPNATIDFDTRLRQDFIPLVQTGPTRELVLFEGLDNFGRLQPLLGTLAEGSLAWFEPITENPILNDIEVWEIYNATEDAHPIHLHLVAFQIIDRES
ncbi:MAG TPA: multicopper oxidase domain-containing protein, partial [Thermodesulfobacteriota bacterium]